MTGRAAPRAVRTSDAARPRLLLLSALGAAAGVGIVLAVARPPLGEERPLARPHALAKVACASCHEAPGQGCTGCHGASHGSARPGHRALAARGELGCPTCHAQHAGGQGVTFEGDRVVRWGSGGEIRLPAPAGIARGTTVPLVSLAVCARCHDPSRASDPIAACVPARVRSAALRADGPPSAGPQASGDAGAPLRQIAAQCGGEHAGAVGAPGRLACAAQHRPGRFAAEEAAREVATTTPWVGPARGEAGGESFAPAGGALAGAVVASAAARALERRRARAAAPKAPAAAAAATRRRLPTINPQTCLGCYACVDACPFDVLAIEKYVAVVARPDECCGVVLCEQVCPNGSLRVADGEPVLDRPATTDDLESRDVPGLYLAGDLTGLPLIKNAIAQGVRVVDHIAATLPRGKGRAGGVDVLVVGAGPAGLAAALRAKERGLEALVVEQASVAASIKSFPRDKLVHDPPLDLPVEGELWLKEATKEELVAQWTRIVRARAIDVREGHRVVDLRRESDRFVVAAESAEGPVTFRAKRVVLAIGRRGTPRRLDLAIDPGLEDRIAYHLADARSFAGKRVLVVGLGDTAMEAALAIARQPGASVTVAARAPGFRRGKARNIREIEVAMAARKLKVLFETVPVAVGRAGVTLARSGASGGRSTVPADAVLVLIGGLPSWDLLERAGIHRPKNLGEPRT
jgi:thioredoxin reductase/NAD-dependent dihydropyrimidine dehydrogenase PreA subunit